MAAMNTTRSLAKATGSSRVACTSTVYRSLAPSWRRHASSSSLSLAVRNDKRPCLESFPSGTSPPHRRSFFSMNDLAKFAGEARAATGAGAKEEAVTEYHESKVLNYSPSELYAIVSDVDSYDEFLPFCAASNVVGPAPPVSSADPASSQIPQRTGEPDKRVHAELQVGFKSFKEKYTSLVEMKEGHWVGATALPHPLFKHLSTLWSFEPCSGAGGKPATRIDFSLHYAFTSPIYTALAGGVFKELSSKMMTSFEQRAKELYGSR